MTYYYREPEMDIWENPQKKVIKGMYPHDKTDFEEEKDLATGEMEAKTLKPEGEKEAAGTFQPEWKTGADPKESEG